MLGQMMPGVITSKIVKDRYTTSLLIWKGTRALESAVGVYSM